MSPLLIKISKDFATIWTLMIVTFQDVLSASITGKKMRQMDREGPK
jgi:hypothetical protein